MPCRRSPGGGGWYPGMSCRFPGPHPEGKFRGISGCLVLGGLLPGGCLVLGSETPRMATAAGGTHPTGNFNSCLKL